MHKTTEQQEQKHHQTGHRMRLRTRFLRAGPESVQDYELLELILFRAIPRKDVKPLAKEMIEHFGSFADVISAPTGRLLEVKGVSEVVVTELKIVQAAAHQLSRANILKKPVLSSWEDLLSYCRTVTAYEKVEQFRILFLDHKNRLIKDEKQQTGTVNHTPVYPREVVKRAIALDASAIILVHNHPSGDPTPSRADIKVTKQIYDAVQPLQIKVHDHLIIGRGEYTSFKALGLL